jgi:hypothetical protein
MKKLMIASALFAAASGGFYAGVIVGLMDNENLQKRVQEWLEKHTRVTYTPHGDKE